MGFVVAGQRHVCPQLAMPLNQFGEVEIGHQITKSKQNGLGDGCQLSQRANIAHGLGLADKIKMHRSG